MKTISVAAPVAVALGASSVVGNALPAALLQPITNPLSPRATSLPSVTVKGNAFFAGNDRFYIRGVDYQPGGSSDAKDPLTIVDDCKRDIAEFQKLKINTVRVYTVDNSGNHDQCMSLLAQAGIYLALDVNTPKYSINQASPADSYNHVYLQNVFATVEMFAAYSNTLLFFSGNEVINSVATSAVAPYVKAVTRDMKQFIGDRQLRAVPVGYSAADIDEIKVANANYMNCGTDDERSDFFAFNDYSWCDPSSFSTSTWQTKVQAFSNFSIPIFLSEYGCTKTERKFQEVATLYGSQMTSVYSGGLVYEYSKEGDSTQEKFGLVDVSGGSAKELPDFQTLVSAFSSTPIPTGDGGYKSSGSASVCPSKSSTWLVGNDSLPAMPPQASQFLKGGAGKGVGLSGEGSQEAGAESPGTATAGSGQPSTTAGASGSATKKSDAGALHVPQMSIAPMVCVLVVFMSSLVGATLL